MTGQIDATVELVIRHESGPEIADADHVRRWLVADGATFYEGYNGFKFVVCERHPNPDDCAPCDSDVAMYEATLVSVLRE